MAINAALTGHLVFSTLHTNDASGVPPRLLDMGVEPFLLVSSLNCVVGQRVLRRVCKDCADHIDMTPEQEQEMKKTLGPVYDMIEERFTGVDDSRKHDEVSILVDIEWGS